MPSSVGAPSGPRWLLACDLDQTLIYSRRSFRLAPGAGEPDLVTVEHIDGQPAAFCTVRAAELIAELDAAATLVPVTTRTRTQYARVDLGVRPRYAIAANGGHLLVDGRPDADWAARVRGRIAAQACPLADVQVAADRLAADGWVRTSRVADDLFVYLVAYERAGVPDLSGLAAGLAADGWTLSVQGRKVYLVPAVLTKEAALAEVVRRVGDARVAAAGDSLLDRGMLAGADVAVRPAHGELHEGGWTQPNLRVTVGSGLLGGQEILEILGAELVSG
ncbi:sucrose-6-phosphate hydrolase [Frankia sp. Cppng1_Ct_nod]|uniref:sucrose-6-phosphate hydrolase n=1 Tax=Frankia sp. Cppng1_Ct_nod TaxID=2897162 RepID=UPI0010411228|nr:sucrose-6-phosphate hydrolase [Frankia sp. Cppng1_Ct_nod]